MRFDLKRPCKNCPFRSDETGIRFACRERAEDIEESAYRSGFPCHLSADLIEDSPLDEMNGYVFGEETQYCAGHIIFELKSGMGLPWPGIDNDDELADRLSAQVDFDAPVFETVEDFVNASEEAR